MGRIKTTQIKRMTDELMECYGGEFTDNFEENQKILNKFISTPSKKLKNKIAGYITKLIKKSKESDIL